MKYGITFPQTEFGNDPLALRDYIQQAEELGFNHILAYDHVIGANPDRPGGWKGSYDFEDPFFEPFVLFGHIAAISRTLELATGIIILPQRQTVLAAKQAATLDVLSGGRLRLGLGIGWNEVEYVALNQEFGTRGKRFDEQLDLMHKLWAEPLITYEGQWHKVPDAGINPRPVQQPIPIWFGGHVEAVIRRVAKWGAGWMTLYKTADKAGRALEQLDAFLEEEGRSRDEVGIEPRMSYGEGNVDEWGAVIEGWQAVGATHFTLNTMNLGFEGPQKHMEATRVFAEAMM